MNPDYVHMKLLEWLRFPSIDDRRDAITEAHQDTFQWVLSPASSTRYSRFPGSDFVEWLQKGSGVYWIQGKMGCGKSTLMRYVTDHETTKNHLLKWANGQTVRCPSYYFSKIGTSELQKSLQGLYRTLLAILIEYEKGLFRVAFPNWQISDFKHTPKPTSLRRALKNVLTHPGFAYKYCFFIDGLDEYQEFDNGLRGELAKDILGLAQLPDVKLVISSRPESVFKLNFAACPTMELHDLTRSDISDYVHAEIRRKALPQVLTSTETDQLNLLCRQVVSKAEGVFLWVTIAVASILNGIADYEAFPELKSRLGRLDSRLTVLFKQVLTERVQASHRKEVARTLLTECQNLHYDSMAVPAKRLIVQAISPQVDASHEFRLLLRDCREIDVHISELRRCLPGRSCGLYLEPGPYATRTHDGRPLLRELNLSHSSLIDFLDEPETQIFLSKHAGEDFKVDEATVVGLMSNLVYQMELMQSRGRWRQGLISKQEYLMLDLLNILQNIEMIETRTRRPQTKLILAFDEILAPRLNPYLRTLKTMWDPLDVVDAHRKRHPIRSGQRTHFRVDEFPLHEHNKRDESHSDSPSLLPREAVRYYSSDVLSLSITFGFSWYLKHKTDACRGVPLKTGTPLLFYPLWHVKTFTEWLWNNKILFYHRTHGEICHINPVKLLLTEGADPNEKYHGRTPWSTMLHILCSGHDANFPLRRVSPLDTDTRPTKSFFEKLEVAKAMLEHGADPFLRMETTDCTTSPQIFAALLERECCSGYALSNCGCPHAMQAKPRLTELVELIEERKRQKRQWRTEGELRVIAAWLVVILAYIMHNVTVGFL